MSILVECFTVIVPQIVLDISWPGGTQAYLEAAWHPDHPCRYAISDHALTAVSFYHPEHVEAHVNLLQEHGILVAHDEEGGEACVVDQRRGPFAPCEWLEWETTDSGFTHAWRAAAGPGDAVMTWDGWSPDSSRDLTHTDPRENPEVAMRLARDPDGTETWLDLNTGEIWTISVTEEESALYDLLRDVAR